MWCCQGSSCEREVIGNRMSFFLTQFHINSFFSRKKKKKKKNSINQSSKKKQMPIDAKYSKSYPNKKIFVVRCEK
jgi:hypothetical protein